MTAASPLPRYGAIGERARSRYTTLRGTIFFPASFPCFRSGFAAAPHWSLGSSPCDIR